MENEILFLKLKSIKIQKEQTMKSINQINKFHPPLPYSIQLVVLMKEKTHRDRKNILKDYSSCANLCFQAFLAAMISIKNIKNSDDHVKYAEA